MHLRLVVRRLLLALLPFTSAASVTGQQQTCNLVTSSTSDYQNIGTPFQTTVLTGAFFRCPNGREIRADNATYSEASKQLTMWGNVQVNEPERTLRSNFAQYFTTTRQINATDNAVLRDLKSGSSIRGDQIQIFDKSPTRPQSLIIATGRNPRAVIFRPDSAAAVSAKRDSTILDAQEIQLMGDESFRAIGNATMVRDSLRVTAVRIEYAQADSLLQVTQTGVIEVPRYRLTGDSITARVGADNEIRDVLTRHGSALTSDEMNVRAPAIRIGFTDGGISRMTAMNWRPAQNALPGARPRVESSEFRIESDSVDVLAPGQQLTEAVAVGNAYGERISPDSLNRLLPEATPELLAIIGSDWMRGDTVRVFFVENPAASVDTTAAARVVDRLSAAGQPARSMYRTRSEQDPAMKLAINYLIASKIDVAFREGVASVLSASGDARGVYLQPEEAARRAAGNPRRTP